MAAPRDVAQVAVRQVNADVLPRVAELVTHAAALVVARQHTRPGARFCAPSLRPLSWFLGATLAADVARMAIQFFVLHEAARPFAGWYRVAFHLDQLGVVGWNAGLVAVTMLAFLERKSPPIRWPLVHVATTSLTAWLVLVATYPMMRGPKLEDAYMQIELLTVLVCLGVAAVAWSRDKWFGIAARSASVLVVAELATLFGTFLGQPLRFWSTANVVSAVAYAVLVWELRRARMAVST
mgnify:FL=1